MNQIRLAFIGTYPKVSQHFMNITSGMENIRARSIDASFEKAAEIAETLEPELDAILSRGGTAEYIRNAVDIPVIYIPITPFDVVKAIHMLPKEITRIAIIHYHKNVLNIKELEDLYHLQITEYFFEDYGDIERNIRDANERGIQMVIGGDVAAQIAKKYSMQSITVSAGYEAVVRAIEETLQILDEKEKTKNKSAQINVAFSSLAEGVIITNEDRRIVMFNHMAERIFQRRYDVGRYLDDDIFDACCRRIFAAQENAHEENEVRKIAGATYAVSHTPIKSGGKYIGLVSRYEDVTQVQKLEQQIRREIHTKGFNAKHTFPDIIGTSSEILQSIRMAQLYSKADSSVLIEGESGTGKEYFAQSIHNGSARKNGPFVAVNCTAIPENLLESELFGYESGAFTGARKEGKIGLFELAHGGTLFLDEIGEISSAVQTSLLRVLQEREIMRVGGNRVIPVDVRVISATNRPLWQLAKEGSFRIDLYYRLNVLHLNIPPLRRRSGDVKTLCCTFAASSGFSFDPYFYEKLLPELERYSWPGNVRELQSVIERYSLLRTIWSGNEPLEQKISALLGLPNKELHVSPDSSAVSISYDGELKDIIRTLERKIILQTIAECGDDQDAAAQKLGIGKTTLWRKIKE